MRQAREALAQLAGDRDLAESTPTDTVEPPAPDDARPWSQRHPWLRVGSVGTLPWPLDQVPSHDLAHGLPDDGWGIDLVLVAGGGADDGWTEQTRAALLTCEEAGIPTILVTDDPAALTSPLTMVCSRVATHTRSVAAAATALVGEERTLLLPVAVDARTCNPVDHVVDPTGRVLLIEDAGAAGAGPLGRPLRDRGLDVEVVDAGLLDQPERVGATAHGSALCIGPDADASAAAWRVAAALAACGVPLIDRAPSTGALATRTVDEVTSLLADGHALRAAGAASTRRALRDHDLAVTVDAVLDAVDIPTLPGRRVTAIVNVRAERSIARIRDTLARQDHDRLDAILVVDAGAADAVRVETARWACATTVVEADPRWSTADRLNQAAADAQGEIVAFLDPNGFYGMHHVSDAVTALGFSGADIVGRRERFIYDADRDETALVAAGSADRYEDRVAAATIVMHRETALRYGFLRSAAATDRPLMHRVRSAGGRVYAMGPFGALVPGRIPAGRADVEWTQDGAAFDVALPSGDGGVPLSPPSEQRSPQT